MCFEDNKSLDISKQRWKTMKLRLHTFYGDYANTPTSERDIPVFSYDDVLDLLKQKDEEKWC